MPTEEEKKKKVYTNADLAKYESSIQGPQMPTPYEAPRTLDTMAEAQESEASRRSRGLGAPSGYDAAAKMYEEASKLSAVPGTKVARIKAMLGAAEGLSSMQHQKEIGEIGMAGAGIREREMQNLRDIESAKLGTAAEKLGLQQMLGEERVARIGERSGYLAGLLEEKQKATDIARQLADYKTEGGVEAEKQIVELAKAKAKILQEEGPGSESTWLGLGGADDTKKKLTEIDNTIKTLQEGVKRKGPSEKKKEWENYR